MPEARPSSPSRCRWSTSPAASVHGTWSRRWRSSTETQTGRRSTTSATSMDSASASRSHGPCRTQTLRSSHMRRPAACCARSCAAWSWHGRGCHCCTASACACCTCGARRGAPPRCCRPSTMPWRRISKLQRTSSWCSRLPRVAQRGPSFTSRASRTPTQQDRLPPSPASATPGGGLLPRPGCHSCGQPLQVDCRLYRTRSSIGYMKLDCDGQQQCFMPATCGSGDRNLHFASKGC
eukprot:SM000354S13404  [mRNA]  locus=s354:49538:50757:- [translate_table: standard]